MANRDYTIAGPDGREVTITGPDDATPAQLRAAAEKAFSIAAPEPVTRADLLKRELLRSPPVALARGFKDIVDTGADWLSNLGGADENARVKAMNAAGKAEFDEAAKGQFMPQFARFGGNVAATAPVGPALSVYAKAAGAPAALVNALQSAGMTTGGRAPGALNLLKDIGTRSLAGGIVGGASTGLIDQEHAGTGAMIGAAMPPALKVAGEVGKGVAKGATGLLKHVLGLATGVGPVPLSEAYKAGKVGSKDFADNITGNVPLTDVLDRAKQGLAAMSAAKSAEYRAGMIPVGNDKTVLGFAGIDKALADAAAVTAYKGQVKNESAARVVAKMRDIVDEWKGLDPAQYHTPEGLDALKQKLGSVLESTPFEERTARLAAGKIYNATKAEIEAQAPSYAAVMKDYSDAATQITEIERALSLGSKSAKDTAMRKLQSLMRNNVQTNYGNRLSLARELEQNGGVELMPALSGQALNSWTPRSLAGQIGGGATAFASMSNPAALLALPFQSPRIVGNAAYGLGRLSGAVGHGAQGLLPHNALTALGGPNALEQIIYRATPAGLAVGR